MTPLRGPLLVLTDRRQASRPLPDLVASAVHGGARAVVMREKDLPPRDRRALAAVLRALLEPVDGVLVVAGTDGDAVHLPAATPVPHPRPSLVGRSCHGTAEVEASSDVDYVTLSPIFPTPSKPGYGPALGPRGLGVGAVPVYALGGVSADNAGECRRGGAAGVAVMGAIMRSPDPASTVREILAAWHD